MNQPCPRVYRPCRCHPGYEGPVVCKSCGINDIGIEQAKALADILKEHPALKFHCGNKDDETELDMSGKNMRAEGAIMLVPEIIGKRVRDPLRHRGKAGCW
jgi:hypothetical protein